MLGDLGATHYTSSRRHVGGLLWLVIVVAIIVALLLGFIGGLVYDTMTTASVYAQFAIADQDIGAVCAGAQIEQSNSMTANGPAVINMVATIYDDQDRAFPPVAKNYWLAIPDEREITDIFRWEAPTLPPNAYIRVLAANSESVKPPAISITHFTVKDCP